MSVSVIGSTSGASAFSVSITSVYQTVLFTQQQPAGAYTFTSQTSNNTMDLYFYNATGTLVASTNGKAIQPSIGFNKLVIIGGTVGDVLTFTAQTTYGGTAETAEITAGPVILSVTPTSLPNVNSTTTVTGINFASNIVATFTGTDNLQRNAKSVVYGSTTSIIVTRPDTMPVTYSPYTLSVSNPGVTPPTGSTKNQISVTAGVNPVWQTSSVLYFPTNYSYSNTLSATDADGGSSVTYSVVSGSFPTGLSFNTSTGAITGTSSSSSQSTVTIRATDSGGNTADRTFTINPISSLGGIAASDSTYYYNIFTSNGTFTPPISLTADILVVAGGGGGGTDGALGGGGGAGGVVYSASQSLASGVSYTCTVGSGGVGGVWNGALSTQGSNSSVTGGSLSLTAAVGGGRGGGTSTSGTGGSSGAGGSGGSGGGGMGYWTPNGGGSPTSGQGYGGGSGATNPNFGTGGGGGAGVAGTNGSGGNGGAGGVGTSTYSSWGAATGYGQNVLGTYYFAGGGGGAGTGSSAAGGYGGGGAGLYGSVPANAVSNTGGGGGGAGGTSAAAGGSGIIIVRYAR